MKKKFPSSPYSFLISLKSMRSLRFYLECIALPFFIFLVIHLAGHGVEIFLEDGEEHTEKIFSLETVFGLGLSGIFIWIWHRNFLKKWIPCAHDHCHKASFAHIMAIVAFCVHFFPEASVRHTLIANFNAEDIISLSALIGFGAHFIVDILVTFLLVSYFKQSKIRIFAGLLIISTWGLAYITENNFLEFFPENFRGIFFILSAFLLAMFIHLPHKPKIHCHTCDH